jgi:hypothetical protein
MAILVPSYTTPQGEVKSNVYAKVVHSSYRNQGSEDPVLICYVYFFPSQAASDAGLQAYADTQCTLNPWAPGGARGLITPCGSSLLVDGETLVFDDGVNPAVTLEFDADGSVVETETLKAVALVDGADATAVAVAIQEALGRVDRSVFLIRALLNDNGTLSLVNVAARAAGNVAITSTVAEASFVVDGMSEGSDAIDLAAVIENQLLELPLFAGGTRV